MPSVTIAVISSSDQSVGTELSRPILRLQPLTTGIYAELLELEAHWVSRAGTALGSCEEVEVRKGTVGLSEHSCVAQGGEVALMGSRKSMRDK